MNSKDDKNLKKIYDNIINEAIKKPLKAATEHEWTSEEEKQPQTTQVPFKDLRGNTSEIERLKQSIQAKGSKSKNTIPKVLLSDDELSTALTGAESKLKKYRGGELPQWGFRQFEKEVMGSYESKMSLMVYGEASVAKSEIVRQAAKKIAKRKNKEFFDWGEHDEYERDIVIQNPEHFFVLLEFNMSEQADTSDIKGTPKLQLSAEEEGKTYSVWVPSKEVDYLRQKQADGILFLDEVLHESFAKPLLFKLLGIRQMGNIPIGDNLGIVAAGNMPDYGDYPESKTLHKPVRTRFSRGIGVLVASPRDWAAWATTAGVDKVIIGYALSSPEKTFLIQPDPDLPPDDEKGAQQLSERMGGESHKYPTPRSLIHFSHQYAEITNAIKKYLSGDKTVLDSHIFADAGEGAKAAEIFNTTIDNAAARNCGTTWAKGFLDYLKNWGLINLEDVSTKQGLIDLKTYSASRISQIGLKLSKEVRRVIDEAYEKNTPQAKKDLETVSKYIYRILTALGGNDNGHKMTEHAKNTWQFIMNEMHDEDMNIKQENRRKFMLTIESYINGLKDHEITKWDVIFNELTGLIWNKKNQNELMEGE